MNWEAIGAVGEGRLQRAFGASGVRVPKNLARRPPATTFGKTLEFVPLPR